MAVRTLSYLDLTPAQRRKGAGVARDRLRSLMGNPFLTADQKAHLQNEMHRLDLWEKGTLDPSNPPKVRAS